TFNDWPIRNSRLAKKLRRCTNQNQKSLSASMSRCNGWQSCRPRALSSKRRRKNAPQKSYHLTPRSKPCDRRKSQRLHARRKLKRGSAHSQKHISALRMKHWLAPRSTSNAWKSCEPSAESSKPNRTTGAFLNSSSSPGLKVCGKLSKSS